MNIEYDYHNRHIIFAVLKSQYACPRYFSTALANEALIDKYVYNVIGRQ